MKGLLWTVSLALADETFLGRWRPALRWEDLPKGPLQFILAAAVEHWDDTHKLLDWPSFLYYLDTVIEEEDLHGEYRQEYVDLTTAYAITESSRPVAWEAAEKWIRDYHIGMALDRSRAALAAGDTAGAFQELLTVREVVGNEPSIPLSIDDAELADILRQRPEPSVACPTGVLRVDEFWEGGVYPNNLAIVAADTNVGKSMMLCFLAASAYRANKRALYFTYELTKAQVAERILTGLFGCAKQYVNPDTVVDKLVDIRHKNKLTAASLVIDDGSGIQTVADLKARLEQENVDLVLLDSADDLHPSRRYSKEYEAYKEIYTDIRLDICQNMGLPVWTSVQMNRDAVEKARTSLKHISDAFAKVQRAHLVLGMSQTVDEREHFLGPFVKLVILKDTEHGSRGKWDRYRTAFGRGNEGWPGFEYWPERGDLD